MGFHLDIDLFTSLLTFVVGRFCFYTHTFRSTHASLFLKAFKDVVVWAVDGFLLGCVVFAVSTGKCFLCVFARSQMAPSGINLSAIQ